MKETLPLEKWLLHYAKQKALLVKRGEDNRTQVTVEIHRRFRGTSLSDRIGRFIPGGTGKWKGDNSGDLEGVTDFKTVNIVKPTVKMQMAALSSARVSIQNDPANKDPALRGAANVTDGIVQYIDGNDDYWSGGLESRCMQMCQTGYGYFIHAKHNPSKKSEIIETETWEEQPETIPGEYACGCGSSGPYESEDAEQTKCPKCGEMAEITKPSEQDMVPRPGQKEQFSPGDCETEVSSSLEHRVDERNSQGGNLLQAKWFEHHYLVTDEELYHECPKFKCPPSTEWSYPLRWKWTLETGDDAFSTDHQSEERQKRHERQDWYLLPEEYAWRVEPENAEIKHGNDVVFSIKRGERLADKCPDGFMFSIIEEKVYPVWREVDFRNEWAYGGFMPDAHSFWYQPLVELLQLQDDWNTLYTIDIQHRERNSLNQIVYNSQMFDADAWEHDLVPTAEGYAQDQSLDFYFKQLQAVPMSEAISGLDFIFRILPYVGGAPPEAIGVDPPGDDNYSAQLLRKQSTLGQLQPAGESKANCKVRYVRNVFKLAQDTWPEERFQYIRTRYGDEWKDDDIEAFLNCDIERDIVTEYIQGTEIPTSYIERRVDLEAAINKFIEAQVPPPKEILKQYFDLLNLDYDMGGMDADERLAESRYVKIKEGLRALSATIPNTPMIDPMTGQQTSPLIQAVLSHPSLQVKPKEGHEVHIDFYVAKEKALMADEMPDVNLISVLDEMIARHEAGGVQETQNQTMQQVAAEAPAIEAQQAMTPADTSGADPQAQNQAAAEQEGQKMQFEAESKAKEQQASSEEAERGRQHESEMEDKRQTHEAGIKVLEMSHKERIAKMQAEKQAQQAKKKAKAA